MRKGEKYNFLRNDLTAKRIILEKSAQYIKGSNKSKSSKPRKSPLSGYRDDTSVRIYTPDPEKIKVEVQ
jgi:hypothetical protein